MPCWYPNTNSWSIFSRINCPLSTLIYKSIAVFFVLVGDTLIMYIMFVKVWQSSHRNASRQSYRLLPSAAIWRQTFFLPFITFITNSDFKMEKQATITMSNDIHVCKNIVSNAVLRELYILSFYFPPIMNLNSISFLPLSFSFPYSLLLARVFQTFIQSSYPIVTLSLYTFSFEELAICFNRI